MTAPANLIFIQSDNHNRYVTGCYGHAIVRTPTLDWIAAHGVRFANSGCVSPLCCPARAAMATGRYAHQTGYWDNAIAYDGRIPSWMHRVREHGHTVVAIGKLHYRSASEDHGFRAIRKPIPPASARTAAVQSPWDCASRRISHKRSYVALPSAPPQELTKVSRGITRCRRIIYAAGMGMATASRLYPSLRGSGDVGNRMVGQNVLGHSSGSTSYTFLIKITTNHAR